MVSIYARKQPNTVKNRSFDCHINISRLFSEYIVIFRSKILAKVPFHPETYPIHRRGEGASSCEV